MSSLIVKTVVMVDYRDLDKLINETFPELGGDYECQQAELWNNDAIYRLYIDRISPDQAQLYFDQTFAESGIQYILPQVLNLLAASGKLPREALDNGEILVNVSW